MKSKSKSKSKLKPTIVFIPGFSFGPELFEPQIKSMKKLGFKCECYVPYLDNNGDTVKDILKKYSGDLYLVGQSMGGRIAIFTAAESPDRVKKIVIFQGGPAGELSSDKIKIIQDNLSNLIEEQIPSGKLSDFKDALREGTLKNGPITDDYRNIFKKMMDKMPQKQYINQAKAVLEQLDLKDDLQKIRAKSLIIHSENDEYFELSDALYLANNIKDSYLTVMENIGHGAMIQAPEMCNSLIYLWLNN